MNATLQSHLESFNETEFNSLVEAFKAAPTSPSQLCQLWQKASPVITLAGGLLVFVPNAGLAINALISALNSVCSTASKGLTATNTQTVMAEVCSVWESASQFLPLILQVPGVNKLPIVNTIVTGLSAALNAICATPISSTAPDPQAA